MDQVTDAPWCRRRRLDVVAGLAAGRMRGLVPPIGRFRTRTGLFVLDATLVIDIFDQVYQVSRALMLSMSPFTGSVLTPERLTVQRLAGA